MVSEVMMSEVMMTELGERCSQSYISDVECSEVVMLNTSDVALLDGKSGRFSSGQCGVISSCCIQYTLYYNMLTFNQIFKSFLSK